MGEGVGVFVANWNWGTVGCGDGVDSFAAAELHAPISTRHSNRAIGIILLFMLLVPYAPRVVAEQYGRPIIP
jgi:hypothetical protein